MKVYKFLLLCLLVLLPTGLINSVEEDSKSVLDMTLEELLNVEIITAGNKYERIGEIPASVVIIDREEIEVFGYQSLEQVLESVVGLYLINDYQGEGDNFGVRGFWKDVQNSAFVILVNGVPQREYFAKANFLMTINVPIEAVSRIEVVRGPLSVIYGSGAFFGAINVITNIAPEDKELSGIVSGTYGSDSDYRIFARVTAGKEDALHCIVNAGIFGDTLVQPYSKMGGIGDCSTKESLWRDSRHFSLSMAHPFGVYANISYDEEATGYPFLFQPLEGNDNYSTASFTRMNLGVRKQLSPGFGFNVDIVYGNHSMLYDYDTQLVPGAWEIQTVRSRFLSITAALFLTTPSKKLDITIGSNYFMAFDVETMFDLPLFALHNSYMGILEPIRSRALYFQGKWRVTENLLIVGGVRFEQDLKYEMLVESNVGMQYVDPQDHYGVQPYRGTGFYDNEKLNIIPRLAAIWTFGEGHVLKFLYGEATSQPSFYINRDVVSDPLHESVAPEKIKTYEFNYTGILSSKLVLGFSAFYNKLNLIIRDTGFDDEGNYFSRWKKTGRMEGWGIESQLTYNPTESLRFYGGFSYQEMKDKYHPGQAVAFSPALLGYVKGAWRLGENLTIAFTGNYVGAMESLYNWSPRDMGDPDSPPVGRIGRKVPGYFNLGMNFRIENLFVSGLYANLRVNNLLDTDIFYPINSNQPWATNGTMARGRAFSLTLGWKF